MKNQFLKGTLILFSTSIMLRGLGFVYQMLVVRLAGTEAVGTLNRSIPFYMIFLVLATFGMPVAIAKLTAQYVSQEKKEWITPMMYTATKLIGILSAICLSIALFLMPQLFDALQIETQVIRCFFVLAPGILIVPFCSVLRGYFQGLQQMFYPSVGQMIEQLFRVGSGLILLIYLAPKDVGTMAMCLASARILGELSGCIWLTVCYIFYQFRQKSLEKRREKQESHNALYALLSLGFPTTITRLTSTIDMAIEASLVPYCLLLMGYNMSQATGIYGQFSGVAVNLITVPTVVTGALATALIPAISEADAIQQKQIVEMRCHQAISLTWMCSLPVIFILYGYGDSLCQCLFQIEGMGIMMRMLSLGAVFLYLEQTFVGILQGIGWTRTVCFNNFCGSVAKLSGMYYCICILEWGNVGIAGGMVLGYGLQCLMNFIALSRKVMVRIHWWEILLPIGYGKIMMCVIRWLYILWDSTQVALLSALLVGGSSYFLLLILTGLLKKREFFSRWNCL